MSYTGRVLTTPDVPAATTKASVPYTLMAAFQSRRPSPVVLLCNTALQDFREEGEREVAAPSIVSPEFTDTGDKWFACRTQGSLKVEYGAGGFSRTVTCDIRSGSWQLPPCQWAKVSAKFYNESAFGALARFAQVALVEGEYVNAQSTVQFSGVASLAAGASALRYPLPPGTEFLRWGVGSPSNSPTLDVQLEFSDVLECSTSPQLYVDFSSPSYVPQIVDLVYGQGDNALDKGMVANVAKSGADTLALWMSAFVRL